MRIIDAQTVELAATFTEPTVDALGKPLDDLAFTTIFDSTDLTSFEIPASSLQGGGNQTKLFPVTVAVNTQKTFQFYAACTDVYGNAGPVTPTLSFIVDRLDRSGPAQPTNFSIA